MRPAAAVIPAPIAYIKGIFKKFLDFNCASKEFLYIKKKNKIILC
jgi:hypothetical protein